MIQPDFNIDPRNGNLIISLDKEDQADLQEQLDDGNPYWNLFHEIMESSSCNGSYAVFDAGDANPFVGLTSATCIAESLDMDDDGNNTIEGELWFSRFYDTENELEELARTGCYVFELVQESHK